MKTKIYISIVLLLMTSPLISSARWYGNYEIAKSGHATQCSSDGFPDVIAPTIPGIHTGSTTTYFTGGMQARVRSGSLTHITCQYWDSTVPTAASLTYANTASGGWQNTTNIVLNWTANDDGGSGLRNYNIRVYRVSPATGTPTVLHTTLSNVATGATTYTYAGANGYAYSFEIFARDNAGNTGSWVSSSDIARIDTTPPVPANLITSTPTGLLAATSQAFAFSFVDAGSPVAITSQIEDYNNPSSWLPVFDGTMYSATHTSNQDIRNVDLQRGANGGRLYTYQVTNICDLAGNCASAGIPRNYNYTVYANPNSTVANTSSTGGTAIADGSVNTFTHTITDQYGNAIIPATGISRMVNQNLSGIYNTMLLDQFTRSGPTSVFVNTNTNSLQTSGSQVIGPRSSTTGAYPLNLYVYTPTVNSYTASEPVSDPDARFGFTSNLVVTDSLGVNQTFSRSLVDPIFRPLYSTSITGDMRDGGFIEGTTQNSTITITKNGSTPDPSVSLQGAFSGADTGSFEFFGNPPNVWFTPGVRTPIVSGVPPTTLLQSRLLQKSGSTVSNLSNLQFSTHFSYTLDSKPVIYNSDIIGRDSYHSGSLTNLGSQYGVHIIGSIASNAVRAITDGQFAANTSIFGGVSRTTIRNNMNKSIALATRNMILGTVGSNIGSLLVNPTGGTLGSGGVITFGSDSSIMSLQKNGGYFDLTNGSITGKRTLVIEGADLYITTDMYYVNSDSILGVVVKKNANGQGGNLYINPNITNIVGSYIIDGSVMTSTDGMNPTGIGDISTLKNQLHIYGSIVSENTIGGSKMLPVKCPILLNISSCTMDEAQKYDLNYLRRYYLYNDNPFGVGTRVIGGATCTSSVCTGFNPLLKQKFNMTTPAVDLAKYPVIIEQNPVIRTNPPPGFDTTID